MGAGKPGTRINAAKTLVAGLLVLTHGHAALAQDDTDVITVERRVPVPAPLPRDDETGPPFQLENAPASTAERAEPEQSQGSDNTTVWGLKINGIQMEEFVPGYTQNSHNYIALGSFAQVMEFPITVDAEKHTAKGWFVREGNTLDINNYSISLKGQPGQLDKSAILFLDDDIYVDTVVVSSWLNASLNIDEPNMLLNITSRTPFPFEERLRRQQQEAFLSRRASAETTGVKRIDTPYVLYETPYFDLNEVTTYDNNSGLSSTYNLLGKGDLGYLTTETFASGDVTAKAVDTIRLNFSRSDDTGRLLGPVKATHFEFGDVDSAPLALTAQTAQGRGIILTNRSLYRADQFDVVSFRGNAQPGWDVELYRNDELLDIQPIGNNGQYEFLDIPIFFGRNAFRIVQYGPQGQIAEETREYYAGATLLDKGQFTYNVSLTDNNASLVPLNDTSSSTSGPRFVSEFEYGLGKWWTLAAGLSHLHTADQDHDYLTGGLRTSFWGVLASLDSTYDPGESASAGRLSLAAELFGIDLRAQHSIYNGLISDENRDLTNLLTAKSDLDANMPINIGLDNPVTATFGLSRNTYENASANTTAIHGRLSATALGITASNYLEKTIGQNDRMNGNFSLRSSIWQILTGLSAEYDVRPEMKLTALDLTTQFHVGNDMLGRLNIHTDGRNNYEATASLTADMKHYGLSFFVGGNNSSHYFAGIGINFSFTKLPEGKGWHFQNRTMADSGGALLRAYLDDNNNGVHDTDEAYLNNVQFSQRGAQLQQVDSGSAFAAPLAPNVPARLSIDKDHLGDPMYYPGVESYEILPRSGHTSVIDYPVYQAALLEGTLMLNSSGQPVPLGRAKVELVSNDGGAIAAVQSEFDGYYLFDKLRPGHYRMQITKAGESQPFYTQDFVADPGQFYTIDPKL